VIATTSFRVDRTEELPVGVQLAWKLRAEILSGRLGARDRLPAVREIAERAGVNVNTARAVYGRLEAEGLIIVLQGSGTFVAEPGVPPAELTRVVEGAMEAAEREGIDPRDVARAIYATGWAGGSAGEGTGLPDVGTSADEAAARRELRRQIGRLEAQLASYPGARPSVARAGPGAAHIADIGELEAARDALIDALKDARGTAERRGERQARSRRRQERKR
jgi:DNA-binding transcriptional regulator YhcF (GntR family)